MRVTLTLGQLLFYFVISAVVSQEAFAVEPEPAHITPYTMMFSPRKNGVRLEQQRIDFDLTKETVLRIGPYLLDETSVSMQVTREVGEFFDLEFGLATERKVGPIYVISFSWPVDYIATGTLEIIDDKGRSIWHRGVTAEDTAQWHGLLEEQNNNELFIRHQKEFETAVQGEKAKGNLEELKKKLQLAHPQKLSQIHQGSVYGLSHKGFFEIPIVQMTEPFRFCLSQDEVNSRLAVCSRRYQFERVGGRYNLAKTVRESVPRVLINDKQVNNKGSAIFLQNDIPIKFSAVLKNGAYFEFISHPKEISVVDMVRSADRKTIEIIGYGETPMAQINESTYADTVHGGLLNFMPTIGDLKKYWQVSLPVETPYIYLKGVGGAPFRQSFNFNNIPPETARTKLLDKTPKSTYGSHLWVKGTVTPDMQLSADGGVMVERTSPTEFRWALPTPEKGVYNTGILNVNDGHEIWRTQFDIFRGYPFEFSARLSGVVTSDFTLILLGEVAGQYWFEDIFGWQNFKYSNQRWGVAAKYFNAMTGTSNTITKPGVTNLRELQVANFDLKYRLSPGVWGRDPTVGAILSGQTITYGFDDPGDQVPHVTYKIPVVGAGVFWARSMPKIFDDFFNILPILRYPKWVDWEFLYYPFALQAHQKSNGIFSMNFHGKIQWTKRFFGEMGFGLKNFSFDDTTSADTLRQLHSQLLLAYGTLGLGFNF